MTIIKRGIKMSRNIPYYDDEEGEEDENVDSMGYRLDKTDDNDIAYDAYVDRMLTEEMLEDEDCENI
jgi:hypothetical protein